MESDRQSLKQQLSANADIKRLVAVYSVEKNVTDCNNGITIFSKQNEQKIDNPMRAPTIGEKYVGLR